MRHAKTFLLLGGALTLIATYASDLSTESDSFASPVPRMADAAGVKNHLKLRHSLPLSPDQPFPERLSETGVFADVSQLIPAEGLLPYDINVSFWSDGATKQRWVSLPDPGTTQVVFSPTGEWQFPDGTILVKHFEMPTSFPTTSSLRIETRLLVRSIGGGIHGATYRWRPGHDDADLVEEGNVDMLVVSPGCGENTDVPWYFPGRQDCQVCHTAPTGGVLGLNARQMNRFVSYDGKTTENQLLAWSRMGLLSPAVHQSDLTSIARLSPTDDEQASVEHRARTYLDVNCAMCHRPEIDSGYFDARFDTPLLRQNIIDGKLKIDLGIDSARVISPHDPWRSTLLERMYTTDRGITMPPLGHTSVDTAAVNLMRRWIISMPGEEVMSPPVFSPDGGEFHDWPAVKLSHADPGAVIRYTTTGVPPGKDAPRYSSPIQTSGPVTIRARAYKAGFKKSIVITETFTRR